MSHQPPLTDLVAAAEDCLKVLRQLLDLRDGLLTHIELGPRPWHPAAAERYVGRIRQSVTALWDAATRGRSSYEPALKANQVHSVSIVTAYGRSGADVYQAILKLAEQTLLA